MRRHLVYIILLGLITLSVIKGQVTLTEDILFNFRLPRVLLAVIVGAMLATAGMIYQIVLRNPMADGFTTGAASSAAFGGCLGLALWGRQWLVVLLAIAFAFIGINIVRWISKKAGGFSPITVVLAGITMSVVASGGVSLLKYFFEESMSTLVFWLMGGLSAANWLSLGILFAVFAVIFIYIYVWRNKIALLFLDDKSAVASGINVERLREELFIITTILVALSVSFCGVISFLGLMVPHAVRAAFGHNIKTQIIYTPVCGAIALLFFDLLSRNLLKAGELPVGIITSLAGGVFFGVIIARKGGSSWS